LYSKACECKLEKRFIGFIFRSDVYLNILPWRLAGRRRRSRTRRRRRRRRQWGPSAAGTCRGASPTWWCTRTCESWRSGK